MLAGALLSLLSPYRASRRGTLMRLTCPCFTGLAQAACLMRTAGQGLALVGGGGRAQGEDRQRVRRRMVHVYKPRSLVMECCDGAKASMTETQHSYLPLLLSGQRSKPSVHSRQKRRRGSALEGWRVDRVGAWVLSAEALLKPNTTYTGTQPSLATAFLLTILLRALCFLLCCLV